MTTYSEFPQGLAIARRVFHDHDRGICDDSPNGIRGTAQTMSLFEELKRRNVIRMVGLYVVGAWLITQVATRGGVHP
jgi:hypothetical protein